MCPVFHELWSVAIWLVGLGIHFVSHEHWGLFSLSFRMVHSLKLFPRTDVLICWIRGKDICKFPDLIVHFSPPWNSVLWMVATHVYWDFRLQLLNLRDCWGFAWVFPFCITSGNSLKVANWGNRRTHLICFLSHGPPLFLLLNIQSQTVVLYMLYFPLVFVIRVNLVPVIPLWLEAQVSIYRILQMYAYVRFFSWEPPYIPWGSLKSM